MKLGRHGVDVDLEGGLEKAIKKLRRQVEKSGITHELKRHFFFQTKRERKIEKKAIRLRREKRKSDELNKLVKKVLR